MSGQTTHAQSLFDRSDNVAVRDRPRPDYEALGVRAGAFIVLPKLTLGSEYDDNILAQHTDRLADAVFQVEPELTIKSDWNRSAVELKADTTLTQYANHSDQDSDQYNVALSGRLDIVHWWNWSGEASYGRVLIPRTSDSYDTFSKTPLLYDEFRVRGGHTFELARFKITTEGLVDHVNYENGVSLTDKPVDETFHDRDTYRGVLRVDYAVTQKFALFAEHSETFNYYFNDHDRNQVATETLVGPNFELGSLITAELGVGYLTSSFSDHNAKSVGVLHGRADITYFPSPLLTITLGGREGLVDSGVVNSPAYFSKHVDLRADYELKRNIIVSGEFGGAWNDYKVILRHDVYLDGKISATYLLNRAAGLVFSYDRLSRSSSGADAGRKFNDNAVRLTLTLQK